MTDRYRFGGVSEQLISTAALASYIVQSLGQDLMGRNHEIRTLYLED